MKTKIRILVVTVLAIMMLLSSAVSVFGATVFTDLKTTHWAYDAIMAMSEAGVIKGYGDGTFKKDNTVTYGEFIKMVFVQQEGWDPGNAIKGNWASDYYAAALEEGYFTEAQIPKNNLSKAIPRKDMALVVSNSFGNKTLEAEEFNKIYKLLTDVDADSTYAKEIAEAVGFGIITGYENNTFRSDRTLTRAEAATVVYRIADSSARIYPEYDDNGGEAAADKRPISEVVTAFVDYETKAEYVKGDDYNPYNKIEYYVILDEAPCEITRMRTLVGTERLMPSDMSKVGSMVLLCNTTAYSLTRSSDTFYLNGLESGGDLPAFEYVGVYTSFTGDTLYLISESLIK